MNELDTRDHIEEALAALGEGLAPLVAARFHELAPSVSEWTDILERKDRQAGRSFSRYNPRDLSLILRAFTESFGTIGYPFAGLLGRQAQNWASELRDVRNKWAHNEEFSTAETYRALDSAEMLLRGLRVEPEAIRVHELKTAVLAAMAAESGTVDAPPGPSMSPAPMTEASPAGSPSEDPVVAAPVFAPPAASGASGRAVISVSALPDLSYAHARNAIAVVDEVRIDYQGDEMRGASVEIEAICTLGSLGDPKVVIADLDGTTPTTLRNADLVLDPARMLAVEHPTSGVVRVTLRDARGSVVAHHDTAVTVLAANQWRANPPQLSLELLASFVQPNSPAIAPLLVEASDRLQRATGNAALDGYQQGSPERVDAIVEAIYESMRARDIRYAEPPASWGLEGQKVRTPSEVLEGRLGTCLDTTVTLAAALEEAGINSTLWLLSGHIFLGYWRDDASLDGPAQMDAAEVANYVGIGQIEVLETTFLTGGQASKPFAAARRQHHLTTLAGDVSAVQGITDVMQARLARIYPLPSRAIDASGEVKILEYTSAQTPEALHYVPTDAAVAGGTASDVPPRVSLWKNALLDLSLRNRLINYGDKSGYPIAIPQPSLAEFEDMINKGTTVTLLPSDRISTIDEHRGIRFAQDLPEATRAAILTERKQAFVGVTEATYTTRLRALAYKARTILEETGANNLYLAFGMLRWTFNDRELRSPLVLVPVSLEAIGGGNAFRLSIDEAGESTPNFCLLEKLRLSFGLDIPGLANPSKDESGIDLSAALTATRRALTAARLPFTVEDTVDLSILQFAKYRLWKDLDENWKELAQNSLVKHLIRTPTAEYSDPYSEPTDVDLDALNNAVPVPADSSQLDAVAEAEASRTFVLEGPPGTGKSQTITNLLAHSLANGKRVLFVAEKRAALDVVKDRLDAVGLGPFSLDLHDKGARPNAVRAQIRAAIDAIARPDAAALKADTETAATSRGSLKRYAQRLHEPNSAGLSIYSARQQLLASADDIEPLELPATLVATGTEEQFAYLRDLLRTLPETADLAHPSPSHPWGFVPVSEGNALDTSAVHAAAQEFDAALRDLLARQADPELLALTSGPAHLDCWASLANAPRHSLDVVDALYARTLSGEVSRIQEQLSSATSDRPWFATVGPEALDGDLQSLHRAATEADGSGFFGRRKRQRAVLSGFGTALRVEARAFPARDVTPLVMEVARAADEVAALRATLAALPLPLVSSDWNPYVREGIEPAQSALAWGVWLGAALSSSDGQPDLRSALRRYYAASTPDPDLSGAIARLAAAWRTLATSSGLSEPPGDGTDAFSAWAGDYGTFQMWMATARARNLATGGPVTLDRWVAFRRHIEPLTRYGMTAAHAALLTGAMPADLASLALDKGIAHASVLERAESQAMTAFDVPAHNRTIDRFTSSATAIRNALPRWIPAEIIAKRRIDPAYEGGMMGELKRQLARQRGGMTVRALFENYGDLITQIAPCVLMSPESVARFFPAKAKMFDIVVFDEASQIRVADAVGAMGRGTSVVVVGDSKQMPPSSFADVGGDIESDASAVADVVADEESILTECVQARVPRKWLSWHYRSQDEALISFSNHAYYDSRLSSFPAPWPAADARDDLDHGISIVRVAGTFNRSGRGRDLRTNIVEARAIVREVEQRFASSLHETPSLGIITFNAQQRTLIETLLRESPDARLAQALDERDGLFVKNLENVQGDERDTILFSVAFSANDRGVIPLNFGPLSRAGGERRLNVAITRARRQVILFASFDPSELRAEETASIGIKHLKGYLELAASGVESTTDSAHREQFIDRHRDEIADELRHRGFVVQTDIGLSDFRVDLSIAEASNPSQPLVAVLLDGESWRSRRTVADRDGLPVDVLKGLMKWPSVERVWMPEWLQQRETTLARLSAAVTAASAVQMQSRKEAEENAARAPEPAPTLTRAAHAQPNTDEPVSPVRAAPAPVGASRETELRHQDLRQYVEWAPKRFGSVETLDRLPQGAAAEKVRAVLREIVQKEGPIHKMRLARLAAEAFGLNRVAAARSDAILRCLPQENLRASDRACAWPTGIDPRDWREVRRSQPGDGRNLDHVPLEEVANAMAVVSELGGGMNEDELKRQALALFGGKRMTEGVSSRLDAGLQRGVETGRIERDDRGLFRAVARD
ncbi:DUF3320 domain-containing protein [Microbacterium sp. C7(2022)]|uniref:DUF3320 domain-containing protein n=1 Tax=Microbacterium sp. C7(2022) TaxID=2992759 RepID=UPI00237A6199|nr:DUF3320 domain-containing protein [Microbacterium sp. C7(2022)]MDE0546352.1 DUF3320 domain-containing protein [Microbacterium sp. C7(2022)]